MLNAVLISLTAQNIIWIVEKSTQLNRFPCHLAEPVDFVCIPFEQVLGYVKKMLSGDV